MAMQQPDSVQYTADTSFEYVVVATGPGVGRAETRDGLGVISHGSRPLVVSGKVANVRERMRFHYPNATEVGLGKRVSHLHAVKSGIAAGKAKRVAAEPIVLRAAALPMPPHTFQAKKVNLTEQERYERYGDPWDQIHPMFKPLLTRDCDSRFAMTHRHNTQRVR